MIIEGLPTPQEDHRRRCEHLRRLLSSINDGWSPNTPYEEGIWEALQEGLQLADISANLTEEILQEVFAASRFRQQVAWLSAMADTAVLLHRENPELQGFRLSGEADAAVMGFLTFACETGEIRTLQARCTAQQKAFADLLGLEFPYRGRRLEG